MDRSDFYADGANCADCAGGADLADRADCAGGVGQILPIVLTTQTVPVG